MNMKVPAKLIFFCDRFMVRVCRGNRNEPLLFSDEAAQSKFGSKTCCFSLETGFLQMRLREKAYHRKALNYRFFCLLEVN